MLEEGVGIERKRERMSEWERSASQVLDPSIVLLLASISAAYGAFIHSYRNTLHRITE